MNGMAAQLAADLQFAPILAGQTRRFVGVSWGIAAVRR